MKIEPRMGHPLGQPRTACPVFIRERVRAWGSVNGGAMSELTHLDAEGRARMVDVGPKEDTQREAVARGAVLMRPETLRLILAGGLPKGDVLSVARIAGIMAAKRASELIPLCHPLLLTHVAVELS